MDTLSSISSKWRYSLCWLFIAALLLLIVVCLVNIHFLRIVDTSPDAETVGTRQAELDALYAKERVPQVSAEENYGLEDETAPAQGIGGYLLLSGVDQNAKSSTLIYSLDMSQSEPKPQQLLVGSPWNASIEFSDVSEPADFFFDGIDSSVAKEPDGTKVKQYDAASDSLKSFNSITGTYTEHLAWSFVNDHFAYSRLAVPFVSYTDLVSVDSWETVVSNLQNDSIVTVLPKATQPKWSPDGSKLVVLETDGLYAVNVASGTKERITPEATLLATSMFDISQDGRFLVQTVGKSGIIIMYVITSWEPFHMEELGRIKLPDTEFYWPQFSPNGDYYVVQAIDAAEEGATVRNNPRLEVRPTLGRNVLKTFTLPHFDFNALFTDTWLAALPAIDDVEQ